MVLAVSTREEFTPYEVSYFCIRGNQMRTVVIAAQDRDDVQALLGLTVANHPIKLLKLHRPAVK